MDQFLAFWEEWHVPLRIASILIGTVIVRWIALVLVKRVIEALKMARKITKFLNPIHQSQKHALFSAPRPWVQVLGNLITWTLLLFAAGSVLSELGIAVGALIASAGIVGAAIGFGAQSLVRDLISGMFIIFEDQFGVGDSVDLGEARGVIETVGLRVTQVRDVSGTLWYVRNGEITRVGTTRKVGLA